MPTPERLAEQFEEHRTARAGGRVSHARIGQRGGGRRPGSLDPIEPHGCQWCRQPAGMADDGRGARVPGHAANASVAPGGSLGSCTCRIRSSARSVVGDEEPETDAILADSVGLALLVVLEKLEPAERLAFVLHDVFGMTFEEIAPIVDRSVVATRQLASRARRRVQGQAPTSDADLRKQRRVVDAFLAAVQDGDFEALVAVLDPEIVLRADGGASKGMSRLVRGAQAVVGTGRGVLEARVVQSGGPGERQHWRRVAPAGRARAFRDRLHDCRRQGRRDGHPGGSRPARVGSICRPSRADCATRSPFARKLRAKDAEHVTCSESEPGEQPYVR